MDYYETRVSLIFYLYEMEHFGVVLAGVECS